MSAKRRRGQQEAGRHLDAPPEKSFRTMGSLPAPAAISAFFLFFVLYVWIASLISHGETRYVFDFIERFRIFGVDDMYRFFYAKCAWLNPDLYSWSYTLPGGLVADGALSSTFHANAFLMRSAHAFLSSLSLVFLYLAGRKAGAGSMSMLFAILILGFMPLYALVSLSFLGESWLVFMVSVSLYLFVKKHLSGCVLVVGLMPLFRPEGIFMVLPLLVFLLHRKNWRMAILLLIPGVLYFIYLWMSLDSLWVYGEWRFALRKILNIVHDPLAYRIGIFSTFNPLWLVPSLAALFLPRMRALWPFSVAAAMATAWLTTLLALKLTNYEPRYMIFVMPIFAISWAMLFEHAVSMDIFSSARSGLVILFSVISLFVIVENFLQVDFLRARFGGGMRWPIKGLSPLPVSFGSYGEDRLLQRKNIAEAIEVILEGNPGIKNLLVANPEILLDIDPGLIPRGVRVSLIQVDYDVAVRIFQGEMLALFPGGAQYAYFHVNPERDVHAARALYVGNMSCPSCVPLEREGEFSVYGVDFYEYQSSMF